MRPFQVTNMARVAVALALLSLLVTAGLAAIVIAPDYLPSRMSALAVSSQSRATAEQMQSVTQKLDRVAGDIERLRRIQLEQGNTFRSQDTQLQQAIASLQQDVATLRQNVDGLQAALRPAPGGSRPKRR